MGIVRSQARLSISICILDPSVPKLAMQQVGWILPHLPGHSSHLKQQPEGLVYFRERLLKSWIQNSPGGDAAKSGHGTSSSSSIKLLPDFTDNCGFFNHLFSTFLKRF